MTLLLLGIFESDDNLVKTEFTTTAQKLGKLGHVIIDPSENEGNSIQSLAKQLIDVDGLVLLRGWECSNTASELAIIAHLLRKDFWFSTNRGLYRTGVASDLHLTPLLPSDFADIL